jgi:hypothetical protein
VVTFWEYDAYKRLYVVTTNEQITIPEVVQGAYTVTADAILRWYVETHDAYDSVDEIAEPGGYLDPLGYTDAPVGPRRADGHFTQSFTRGFRTAP